MFIDALKLLKGKAVPLQSFKSIFRVSLLFTLVESIEITGCDFCEMLSESSDELSFSIGTSTLDSLVTSSAVNSVWLTSFAYATLIEINRKTKIKINLDFNFIIHNYYLNKFIINKSNPNHFKIFK